LVGLIISTIKIDMNIRIQLLYLSVCNRWTLEVMILFFFYWLKQRFWTFRRLFHALQQFMVQRETKIRIDVNIRFSTHTSHNTWVVIFFFLFWMTIMNSIDLIIVASFILPIINKFISRCGNGSLINLNIYLFSNWDNLLVTINYS
jgi:hypothetical protein